MSALTTKHETDDNKAQIALPTSSGWTAMDKTVREFDEALVKGYKEDIDTLLVFAGLFSAVMTAFIIESYKTLSEDPTEISAQVLRQISMQLNSLVVSINNGTAIVNPIVPPFPGTTFRAPRTAVHVNILWFASLILSLVTASLGILVKSWLTGYLASDNTSPIMRLRVRFFRYMGLREWGVFEIAALLPLLIQVALGLFFLGLCFFTFSVHHSVGITSIAIISTWSLLIIVSIFLPIVVSRCPYRTPLPGNLFSWIRRNLFFRRLNSSFDALPRFGIPFSTDPPLLRNLPLSTVPPLPLDQLLRHDYNSCINPWTEEKVIAQVPWLDNHIIVDVDRIQADDQLLPSSIIASFLQTGSPRETVIPFVIRLLQDRRLIKSDDLQEPLPSNTTIQLWQSVSNLVANTILEEVVAQHGGVVSSETDLPPIVWGLKGWMPRGALLIVCNAHLPRPSSWRKVLSLCTMKDFHNLLDTLLVYSIFKPHDRDQKIIALWETDETVEVPELLQRLRILLLSAYKAELRGNTGSLLEVLREFNFELSVELERSIKDALRSRIDTALGSGEDEWVAEAVHVLICRFNGFTGTSSRQTIRSKWLLHANIAFPVLEAIFMSYKNSKSAMDLFTSSYHNANLTDRDIMQNHIVSYIDKVRKVSPQPILDLLGVCLWLLRTTLDHTQINAFGDPPTPTPQWFQIWSGMTFLIAHQRKDLQVSSQLKLWYLQAAVKCVDHMIGAIRKELPSTDPLVWLDAVLPKEFLQELANTVRSPGGTISQTQYGGNVSDFLRAYP